MQNENKFTMINEFICSDESRDGLRFCSTAGSVYKSNKVEIVYLEIVNLVLFAMEVATRSTSLVS